MNKQNIGWNVNKWNDEYLWPDQGEEWSHEWGSSWHQWQMTILPRIKCGLPAANIIEIAPGYGRWSRFLIPNCKNYIGIDISENAINQCKSRFSFDRNANFLLTDGKTISCKNNSIDFIFSMDSLVHAEIDVIESYIQEFERVLSDRGIGFIHHSNMGEHFDLNISNNHLRATTMSADIFRNLCLKYGLKCLTQEKVNWGQDETNDCFSLFARSEKLNTNYTNVLDNKMFHLEIQNSGRISDAYRVHF